MATSTGRYRIGLRFARSQRRVLEGLVESLRPQGNRPDFDIGVFESAAEAARRGEPLVVICEHPSEAEVVADGFTRWGVKRPAIEELNH